MGKTGSLGCTSLFNFSKFFCRLKYQFASKERKIHTSDIAVTEKGKTSERPVWENSVIE